MTLKDIYSLLAAVRDLNHLIHKVQLTRCYKFGGFCHYKICPGNSRFISTCHPETLLCCKNIKRL
ncbi:beta-defensin 10-like [Mus pahari]|uniref:beta-defensin 10-like n=1 Tax=Mus pahari TaxID=10093 RepID=UPI000A305C38|nr:beta-defensin 10-like [Mus pahari]